MNWCPFAAALLLPRNWSRPFYLFSNQFVYHLSPLMYRLPQTWSATLYSTSCNSIYPEQQIEIHLINLICYHRNSFSWHCSGCYRLCCYFSAFPFTATFSPIFSSSQMASFNPMPLTFGISCFSYRRCFLQPGYNCLYIRFPVACAAESVYPDIHCLKYILYIGSRARHRNTPHCLSSQPVEKASSFHI